MGSLVKLGPGCRQNTELRTPSPWTPEYSFPPLPSSSCASSTPAPASNVTSATHTTTSTAATPSTSRTHPMSRRHKSSWPSAPQMAKNTSAGKSTRTCAVTRGSSGAVGTRLTPRAVTATPPCWRSTTLRSAPATTTAATPPAFPRLRCRADCCGSGLPASLDHAAISTLTVPRPLQIKQHQFQKLQIQHLQCSLETETTTAAVLKLQQLQQQLQLLLQLLLC